MCQYLEIRVETETECVVKNKTLFGTPKWNIARFTKRIRRKHKTRHNFSRIPASTTKPGSIATTSRIYKSASDPTGR
jgi:hypothetical protein